jgi:transcriptional regulator with XRE-family HTH domain
VIGDRIRQTRERAGMTQAGVGVATVNRIERNVFAPRIPTLLVIADVLRVSLDYLAGRAGRDDSGRRAAPPAPPAGVQRIAGVAARLDEPARKQLLRLGRLLLSAHAVARSRTSPRGRGKGQAKRRR